MNLERHPIRHPGPPQPRATPGDMLFALGIAALGLAFAGGFLAAGGGTALPEALGLAEGPGAARSASASDPAASPASPVVTPVPTPAPTLMPSTSSTPTPTPTTTAAPTSTPGGPFAMNLYRAGVFVHQVDKEACVAAAAQNMLNVIRLVEDGATPDVSAATQRALEARIVDLTTTADSHNGGTGPGGWAALLTEEGYPYEVRVYDTRAAAIRAAATAIRATRRPVGILAWGGVHSWVMTGFRASADPAATGHFTVSTAYVLDPWYPWVSTRWPRSEAPNAPRDAADLAANILPWKLGSGPYPGRDGKFLLVIPSGG